eukprot:GHVT01037836.1.p2 GENE.GHVT01037836.1~~GHVT01037836.1.p2  ORF type:complete len:163 (-),score=14.01 GHVT01037836.1:1306-1794(-)
MLWKTCEVVLWILRMLWFPVCKCIFGCLAIAKTSGGVMPYDLTSPFVRSSKSSKRRRQRERGCWSPIRRLEPDALPRCKTRKERLILTAYRKGVLTEGEAEKYLRGNTRNFDAIRKAEHIKKDARAAADTNSGNFEKAGKEEILETDNGIKAHLLASSTGII